MKKLICALSFLALLACLILDNGQPLVQISENEFLNFQITFASVGKFFAFPSASPEEADDDQFFTVQPADCTVKESENLCFSVAFSFDGGSYSIRWQYQPEDSNTWFNSTASTAQKNTLYYSASLKYTGRHYRCIITNCNTGEEHVSRSAQLTVLPS